METKHQYQRGQMVRVTTPRNGGVFTGRIVGFGTYRPDSRSVHGRSLFRDDGDAVMLVHPDDPAVLAYLGGQPYEVGKAHWDSQVVSIDPGDPEADEHADSRWDLKPDDERVLLAKVLERWAPGGIECRYLHEMDLLLRYAAEAGLVIARRPW